MKNKVFLGGSCTNKVWRDQLIPMLKVDYFNPLVDKWSEENRINEEKEKNGECNIHVYYIDSSSVGKYSYVEIGISIYTCLKTIVQFNPDGFTDKEIDNIESCISLINENGGEAFIDDGLEYLATIINNS